LANKIALMKRGGCMFAEKVKHAEFCGAIGALIVDNQPNTVGTEWEFSQWQVMAKP